MQLLIYYFLAINLLTLIFFWVDKGKARRGSWRISEKTLIVLSWLGGFVGALYAMDRFRHKTKKGRFQIWIYLATIVWMAIGALVLHFIFSQQQL